MRNRVPSGHVITKLLSALCALQFAVRANAEMHTYKLPQVGINSESCLKIETLLIERFERLAEATVIAHGCEVNPRRSYDLVIEYEKPAEVSLVSTFNEFNLVHGLYSGYGECNADRDNSVTIFKEATGIEPLIAYCFRNRTKDSSDQWELRIDGFGNPRLSPQHIAEDFFRTITGDLSEIAESLRRNLAEMGAYMPKVRISAESERSAIYALYYARRPLPTITYREGQFKSLDACQRLETFMANIFSRAGGKLLVHNCGGSPFSQNIGLYTSGIVIQPLATELTSIKYETFAACEANRQATEAAWRDRAGKNIIGSLCAIEDSLIREFVRMRMFWLD